MEIRSINLLLFQFCIRLHFYVKFPGSEAHKKHLLVYKFQCATKFKHKEFATQTLEYVGWDIDRALEEFKRYPKDKLPKPDKENKAAVVTDTGKTFIKEIL